MTTGLRTARLGRDGDCWASQPDFGSAALKAFAAATGFQEVPRKPGEPHWFEFIKYNRNAFRAYLRHYLGAVRSTHPSFQLCSNWAFSDHMPEVVSADVDWISGDFSPENAVNSARVFGAVPGVPGQAVGSDGLEFLSPRDQPTAIARSRPSKLGGEAAIVLSEGGSSGCTTPSDGRFRANGVYSRRSGKWRSSAGSGSRFARAVPVPRDILCSTHAHYREINSLFGRDLSNLQGSLQALIEGGQVLDLVVRRGLTRSHEGVSRDRGGRGQDASTLVFAGSCWITRQAEAGCFSWGRMWRRCLPRT